jgi:hypothetical protein
MLHNGALQMAPSTGHERVVELLIGADARVNTHGGRLGSVLWRVLNN